MNTEEKSKYDIKGTRETVVKVFQPWAICAMRTSHQGFTRTNRVTELTDQEETLDTTLRHEKKRQASDRD